MLPFQCFVTSTRNQYQLECKRYIRFDLNFTITSLKWIIIQFNKVILHLLFLYNHPIANTINVS